MRIAGSVLANADPGATTIGMALAADVAGVDYHTLPMVKSEEIAEKLEGIYHGYEGTVRFQVKAVGDALIIEGLGGPRFQEVMVPERLEPPVYEYTVYRGGRRMKAVFIVDPETGRVELLYERYRLVKTSQHLRYGCMEPPQHFSCRPCYTL